MNVGMIYTLILRMVADVPLAKELTQEVFISAWNNLDKFRSDISLSDWLKNISVNVVLIEIQTKEKQKMLDKSSKKSRSKKKFTPQAASKNKIEELLFKLDETERIIFVLHDIERCSLKSTSDFMGMSSENEVKQHLRRTRREIIAELHN